ncbi:hypothetical protein MOK15_21365 [Sphingobium sp. BYY-5]|uniref:hypothetical protein n=1 Tax=Sphingobium sp. BYY-5 TaxID=2926400 RepID=UPI001FA80DBC|nr:hypothetical protein [Sphingobium sp. BYY-5]MCI4592609.1 hypothetical protein [Sphingobium sp. BYY-5]
MTEQIDQLNTLLRLRKRDLECCEQAVVGARKHVSAAEMQQGNAAAAHALALSRCAKAMVEQAQTPCDPLVQLHCRAAKERADAAQQLRASASAALAEARAMFDGLKREWLRAQARHDAILKELENAVRQWKRRVSRRADDEVRPRPVALA